MAPPNALSMVKTEVSLLLTSMKCSSRSNFRSTQDESKRALLSNLKNLRRQLNEVSGEFRTSSILLFEPVCPQSMQQLLSTVFLCKSFSHLLNLFWKRLPKRFVKKLWQFCHAFWDPLHQAYVVGVYVIFLKTELGDTLRPRKKKGFLEFFNDKTLRHQKVADFGFFQKLKRRDPKPLSKGVYANWMTASSLSKKTFYASWRISEVEADVAAFSKVM